MKIMFQQLTDDETDDAARRDLIKFLKEMCMFSSTLQASDRENFFQVCFPFSLPVLFALILVHLLCWRGAQWCLLWSETDVTCL